jgi:hypothetical protein
MIAINAEGRCGATSKYRDTDPVYAPRSVYYPQAASTGITLEFPSDIR